MRFKNITSFIKGLFNKEGSENKVADNFLVKLHNADVDLTGNIKRRRGYVYWEDLEDSSSETSSDSLPDVSGGTGFGTKIQAIYQYTDVNNIKYNLVVCNGKVYFEYLVSGNKTWVCLNPNLQVELNEKSAHIDIKSYLDIVFFNDYKNDVYMYNFGAFADGYVIAGNRFIYFAEQFIYFRSYSDFAPAYHTHDITALDDTAGVGVEWFEISGDYRHNFEVGDEIIVEGSTGNDGTYTINQITLPVSDTRLRVDEDITDATVDGTLKSQYRIKIEDNSVNLEGDPIEASLVSIGYIAPSGAVITTADDLKLSYCVRGGNQTTRIVYYVLDNGLNQRATDKCYIIKFNDRLIAQDYVELDMDTNGEILNFGIYNDNIYIWTEDGEVHVLDSDLVDTPLSSGTDIDNLTAPTNTGSAKQFSIKASSEGIFLPVADFTTATNGAIEIKNLDTDFPSKDYMYDELGDVSTFSGGDIIEVGSYVYYTQQGGTYAGYLLKFDPSTETVVDTLSLGGATEGMVYSNSFLWVCTRSTDCIKKIDLTTFTVDNTITVGTEPAGIYEFSSYLWIANYGGSGSVSKLDPTTDIVDATISLNYGQPIDFTDDGTYLWVTSRSSNYITKINVSTDSIANEYNISMETTTMVSDNTHLWVASNSNATDIKKIDVSDGSVTSTISVGRLINYLLLDGDLLWFSRKTPDGTTYPGLSALDKTSESEIKTIFTSTRAGRRFHKYTDKFWKVNSSVNSSGGIEKVAINDFLIRLDFDGDLTYDVSGWKYAYAFGFSSVLQDLSPLELDDYYTYIGSITTSDDGKHGRIKIDDYTTATAKDTETSSYKQIIPGDERWFLRGSPDDTNYRASNSWDWATGLTIYSNFTNLDTYVSNLVFHVFRTVSDVTSTDVDQLQYLGTPKAPFMTTSYDATSTLEDGTTLKYYMVYLMVSGKTTHLSSSTEEYEVPTSGGATEPIKIVLTGLNLENNLGTEIYESDDVDSIQVYRAKKESGDAVFRDPILIGSLQHDGTGWKSGTFDYETFEDNTQDYTYSPFTSANVFNYPVNAIEVHKNRLILVNRIDYDNPNIIQYSDTDVADAMPADNVRDIESGDGDNLVTAKSMGDYLYLFKTSKILAILGDVYDGQLVDIDKTIGSPYKNLVAEYNNVVYFMNNDSIYALSGQRVTDVNSHRIDNYFDTNRNDCIDFTNLDDNGYTYIDKNKKEIHFHVPQKINGVAQITNNLVIIYNAEFNYFKTYEYNSDIFIRSQVKDVSTGANIDLITDYSGNIYKISSAKNDDFNAINYVIRTKPFNLGTDVFKKAYKLIKLYGKYFSSIRVTYWIDDERKIGTIINRKTATGKEEAMTKIWSHGKANTISIEISGADVNDPPIEINEILVGYTVSRGLI